MVFLKKSVIFGENWNSWRNLRFLEFCNFLRNLVFLKKIGIFGEVCDLLRNLRFLVKSGTFREFYDLWGVARKILEKIWDIWGNIRAFGKTVKYTESEKIFGIRLQAAGTFCNPLWPPFRPTNGLIVIQKVVPYYLRGSKRWYNGTCSICCPRVHLIVSAWKQLSHHHCNYCKTVQRVI